MSGCLSKQAVYFDSFRRFRLVDLNPFLFLFPIHKIGVSVSEGNWPVVNRLLKVVKRHLRRQNSTLIYLNYMFFSTLLSNFQKFWGGSSPPPLPLPPLRACCPWEVAVIQMNLRACNYVAKNLLQFPWRAFKLPRFRTDSFPCKYVYIFLLHFKTDIRFEFIISCVYFYIGQQLWYRPYSKMADIFIFFCVHSNKPH